jgi:hypothetical protein
LIRALALACLAVLAAGCNTDTSLLPPAVRDELAAEGILHEAGNLVFRHTENAGREGSRWRDVVASIVVTKETVLIHRNGRGLLRITSRSRRFFQVVRTGPRLRIQVAGSRASETWSFVPPENPDGWANDVRRVIRLVGRSAGARAEA